MHRWSSRRSGASAFGDFDEEHAELLGSSTIYWCLKIDLQLRGQNIDSPLDEISSLGHPERAAICDSARSLVGINTVNFAERSRIVVGASTNAEQPGRELSRL